MAKKNAAATPPAPKVLVRNNHQCRTCIELRRVDGIVHYLAFDSDGGIQLHEMGEKKFDAEYDKIMKDYDPSRAAQLYAKFALDIGATEEAMTELGRLTTITSKEIQMATNLKKAAADKAAAKKTAAKPAKKAAAPKKAANKKAEKPAKPAASKKAAGDGKETKTRKPSAASRFCELIMAGKHTDDEIFAIVKKEFGLSDDKRGYVKWYRNNLKKKGENPPEAKK